MSWRRFSRFKRVLQKDISLRQKEPKRWGGPLAENLVKGKLLEHKGIYPLDGPEGQVDILAIRTEGDHFKFPLDVKGVEVTGYLKTNESVKIGRSKIQGEEGAFFVIVVETDFGHYSYLIFTYSEMQAFLKNKKLYDDTYNFSVPRKSLKDNKVYFDYYEKWAKITGQE